MKYALTLQQLIALAVCLGAVGCGADADGTDAVESVSEPITGGTLTSSPWSSVVTFNGHCTATKIGPRRFLTAGHCLDGFVTSANPTPSLSVTKALDGVSSPISLVMVQAFMHPSRTHLMIQNPAGATQSHYDAAVFDVDQDTPTLATSPVNELQFQDGFQGTVFGYGCDNANASHSGRKQQATVAAIGLSALQAAYGSSQSSDYIADVYSHFVTWTDASNGVSLCPGDSGGPTFRNSNQAVAAINSSRDSSPILSHATRTANIRQWISNPVYNVFQNQSGGFFLNAKTGKCVTSTSSGALSSYCAAPAQTTDVQYWNLGAHSTGYFSIYNGNTGKCLTRLANNTVTTLTCDASSSQGWQFTEQVAYSPYSVEGQTARFSYYRIANKTGLCLEPSGSLNGNSVVMKSCVDSTAQRWLFTQ